MIVGIWNSYKTCKPRTVKPRSRNREHLASAPKELDQANRRRPAVSLVLSTGLPKFVSAFQSVPGSHAHNFRRYPGDLDIDPMYGQMETEPGPSATIQPDPRDNTRSLYSIAFESSPEALQSVATGTQVSDFSGMSFDQTDFSMGEHYTFLNHSDLLSTRGNGIPSTIGESYDATSLTDPSPFCPNLESVPSSGPIRTALSRFFTPNVTQENGFATFMGHTTDASALPIFQARGSYTPYAALDNASRHDQAQHSIQPPYARFPITDGYSSLGGSL